MSWLIDLLYLQHETCSRGTKTRALRSNGRRTSPPPCLLTVILEPPFAYPHPGDSCLFRLVVVNLEMRVK